MGQYSYHIPSLLFKRTTFVKKDVWISVQRKPTIPWFDNFYRRNFRLESGNENRSVVYTCVQLVQSYTWTDPLKPFFS